MKFLSAATLFLVGLAASDAFVTNRASLGRSFVKPSSTAAGAIKIADSILELIGDTPLVRLSPKILGDDCKAEVLCKLESSNPANSVKDRIALSMITEAEARGDISPGKTILVEPTSGNTGIGLAMVAASKGYKLILTMPGKENIDAAFSIFVADMLRLPFPYFKNL